MDFHLVKAKQMYLDPREIGHYFQHFVMLYFLWNSNIVKLITTTAALL